MIVKTLMYAGVSELTSIKLADIDFLYCQIRINKGMGSKDRIVPFSDFQRTTAHARRSDEKEARSMFV